MQGSVNDIGISIFIHHQRPMAAAEQLPEFLVPAVMPAGIGAQKPIHPHHEIGPRGLDRQIKVIVHQAISMNLAAGLNNNCKLCI